MLLYFTRGQKKCSPGLPEDRRGTVACCVSRFIPPDQKQEGEHGQVRQSLQPQPETALHVQVCFGFFFLAQVKRMLREARWCDFAESRWFFELFIRFFPRLRCSVAGLVLSNCWGCFARSCFPQRSPLAYKNWKGPSWLSPLSPAPFLLILQSVPL